MAAKRTPVRAPGELLERLGVHIDSETLRLALTHRSYAYEHGGIPTNERLEFLGDSVLGFSVTSALFAQHPELPEGKLTNWRAALVSTISLAQIARELGVGDYVLLGQGEILSNGKDKSSILADTMEALIGATFLCNGIETAQDLVLRLLDDRLVNEAALGAAKDFKTSVQEFAAISGHGLARYEVEGAGPDHARSYTATLHIGSREYASGTGASKKTAEKVAAAASWPMIEAELAALPSDSDAEAGSAGA